MARSPFLSVVLPSLLAFGLSLLPRTNGFTFTFNNTAPSMCDPVLVQWQGGQPPFRLLLIAGYDYPLNIPLDTATTWSNSSSSGSFVWTANYPSGRRFVAVMSDTNGLATGGVSSIMTMNTGNSSTCAPRATLQDFFFWTTPANGYVNQCSTLRVGWDANATDPIELIGVVPSGMAFVLPAAEATNNYYDWKNNIPSGTTYILTMLDAGVYGNGGSSDFLTVGPSDDSSCIDAASPSQTPGSTWGTSDGKAATTATATPTPQGSKFSTGGIVGVAIAAIIALAAIQIVLFWFFCRTRFRRTLASSPVDLFNNKHEGADVGAPVTHTGRNFFGRRQRDVSAYLPDPYQNPHAFVSEEGRALQGGSPGSVGGDPFDDEGGYLHTGMVRRGSSSTALTDLGPSPSSPGGYPHTGYPPSSSSTSHLFSAAASSPGYSPSSTNFAHHHFGGSDSLPSSPTTPGGGASLRPTPSVVRQTKAMLALGNPDDDMEPPEGQPPRPGPSYHRHQDAGPIELDGPRPARSGEMVDLPPLYSDLGR